jgi:hypothetical protein
MPRTRTGEPTVSYSHPVPRAVSHTVAPVDPSAREDGDALEHAFRALITTLRHECRMPLQPRHLFKDIQSGKPMSMARLGLAFAIVARSPEISAARIAEAAEQFAALMKGCSVAPHEECLASLHVAETIAQGEADEMQLRATLSGGKDRGAVERALESTTRHKVAAELMTRQLAATLRGFVPARPQFIGRTTRS